MHQITACLVLNLPDSWKDSRYQVDVVKMNEQFPENHITDTIAIPYQCWIHYWNKQREIGWLTILFSKDFAQFNLSDIKVLK